MRPTATCLALPLLLAATPALQAQSPHLGFSLNLMVPTGDFASQGYPAYYSPSSGRVIPAQKETYDLGLGGSFTASFPMDRNLALRFNLSATSARGTNRAPGEATINLPHSMVSLGGDLQIFPNATALRHRGLYFVAGLSADFEQFDRSFGDPTWDSTDTTHKSRLGATAGIGHSFGYDAGSRFTLEASFHKTLSGNDVAGGNPPSTDFLKVSFGWVF